MAGTIISTPAIGSASWVDFITQQGKTDKGFLRVSLTNPATTAASSIGTGGIMELAGSIYQFTETSISLATGTASASVAFYFTVIPSAGGTTCTVVMDDTIPTWVDSKQGYYASAASLTRFIGGARVGTAGVYYDKYIWQGGYPHKISLLHIQDEKAQNTAGGTFTSGAWRTRDLNTTKTNEIPGASLTANQFTLPLGTYYIKWLMPAFQVQAIQSKLKNVTDGSDQMFGTSAVTGSLATSAMAHSFGAGRFTITATKTFEIQGQCEVTKTVSGFGKEANFSTEIYTRVLISKIA